MAHGAERRLINYVRRPSAETLTNIGNLAGLAVLPLVGFLTPVRWRIGGKAGGPGTWERGANQCDSNRFGRWSAETHYMRRLDRQTTNNAAPMSATTMKTSNV
jgi:hypothetical protein